MASNNVISFYACMLYLIRTPLRWFDVTCITIIYTIILTNYTNRRLYTHRRQPLGSLCLGALLLHHCAGGRTDSRGVRATDTRTCASAPHPGGLFFLYVSLTDTDTGTGRGREHAICATPRTPSVYLRLSERDSRRSSGEGTGREGGMYYAVYTAVYAVCCMYYGV
jgi:hypothetical protein